MSPKLENCTRFVEGDRATHPPHYEPLCLIALTRIQVAHRDIPPECYVTAMWDSEESRWEVDDSWIEDRVRQAFVIFWIAIAPKVEDEILVYLEHHFQED
jgi:hypothetical protein